MQKPIIGDRPNTSLKEIMQQQAATNDHVIKPPKGFDIMLADAISQFKLTLEQIEKLGAMTYNREIASAQIGTRVYYRRATIERLFGNGE